MATSERQHNLPITTRESLKINSHRPRVICEALKASFQNVDIMDHFMLEMWMEEFKEILNKQRAFASPEAQESLERGFALVNNTFFMGSLPDVKVKFVIGLHATTGHLGRTYGDEEDGNVRIEIDSGPYVIFGARAGWAQEIAGTLVHEMAHAMYKKFACWRCLEDACAFEREVGRDDGHGNAWIDLCKAIEDSWNALLADRLDLGHEDHARE